MANHHFAKVADVWKHLVLCEVPDRLDALGKGVVSIYADAPLPSGGVGSVRFGSEFVSRGP